MEGYGDLEKSLYDNRLPAKCQKCIKSFKPFFHGKCSFCQDLSFQEEVLSYLNRSTRNPAFLECHAFQPLLKLAASPGQEIRPEPKACSAKITLREMLDSRMVKYQRALALQKLARNPDAAMLDIKYHFAWNVIGRRPAFAEPAMTINFISDMITTCSGAVGGFASHNG